MAETGTPAFADAYDVVVLGAGTAGLTAARSARLHGASTLLVEREAKLGGECTFYGCVPSKTLIEAARLYWQIRHAARVGIHVDGLRLDFAELMAHKDRVIADINRDESDESVIGSGIDIARGRATFTGPHTLEVAGREVRGESIVLAQGSDPFLPPAVAGVPHVTNETVFSMGTQPRRLLVLGGGPIGLELGQCFLRLGTEVVVLAKQDQLLPREEAEVGALVHRLLEREGMEIHLGADVDGATAGPDGEVTLAFGGPGGEQGTVTGDRVLVAAGRRPRLEGLGLDRLGVATTRKGVTVDERCRTDVPHVYAAGDVTGTYLFTHWAAHQGRVAGANAAGRKVKTDDRVMPWVTFLDPEVARVGLTEDEARARHRHVAVARFPFSRIDRARTMLETEGFVKIVVARPPLVGASTGGQVVGAHVVGVHAGEMLHEIVVSMQAKTFAGRLAQAIHAYPTLALGVQQAASQLFAGGRALTDAEPLAALE
ncbi:MAG TPA: NAD(P)/FAD-dependent oxidoreductase [Candidatus Dormibacteraeota bacterium]|nr:NAD(P)/FAD-dependent oxidoreductase [Candidatus Dormibacteraeota bacterium]